ncbi:hypothetical protein GGU11DRAFT_760022 [Lentinula aff. detonsa]|nr:hypothetical protein GGU11DRAFT_760022 [Lentinula aff. detonsa]
MEKRWKIRRVEAEAADQHLKKGSITEQKDVKGLKEYKAKMGFSDGYGGPVPGPPNQGDKIRNGRKGFHIEGKMKDLAAFQHERHWCTDGGSGNVDEGGENLLVALHPPSTALSGILLQDRERDIRSRRHVQAIVVTVMVIVHLAQTIPAAQRNPTTSSYTNFEAYANSHSNKTQSSFYEFLIRRMQAGGCSSGIEPRKRRIFRCWRMRRALWFYMHGTNLLLLDYHTIGIYSCTFDIPPGTPLTVILSLPKYRPQGAHKQRHRNKNPVPLTTDDVYATATGDLAIQLASLLHDFDTLESSRYKDDWRRAEKNWDKMGRRLTKGAGRELSIMVETKHKLRAQSEKNLHQRQEELREEFREAQAQREALKNALRVVETEMGGWPIFRLRWLMKRFESGKV